MQKICHIYRIIDALSPIKCLLLRFMLALTLAISTASYASKIVELDINGPIGPAMADYVERGLLENKQALAEGLINYLAPNKSILLSKNNGLKVFQNNQKTTINASNPENQVLEPGWYNTLFSIITNPTIAYLLILIGIYGIFFELVRPGYILPGLLGAISMLLALYALQSLPVNYAGLLLIVLGMAFIIAEGFTPTFGILGIGGSAAFILGSIMLIHTDYVNYQIAWPAIWIMSVINIVFFVFLIGMVIKARRQISRNELNKLIGAKGRAFGDVHATGQAVIRGEVWSVFSKEPIKANKNIVVVVTKGLLLEIEEEKNAESDSSDSK